MFIFNYLLIDYIILLLGAEEYKNLFGNFCPECGGELEFDPISKNFICKNCGLFASREKIDELRYKAENESMDKRRRIHDGYLEWWHIQKKINKEAMGRDK